MLVLSRALSAPRIVCANAAAATGVPGLRVRQIAALLLVHNRGPQRTLELGVTLGTMAGQPVVKEYRRLGLMTLTGRGRDRRLALTESGEELASAFATVLDRLWRRVISDLPEPRVSEVLDVLGSVSGRPAAVSRPLGFPVELIVVLDRLVAQTVDGILLFADEPGLRDAALRPLLLLEDGPATPTALGLELGVGAPAVNLALADSHRTGRIEWYQKSLRLTGAGERVARRIRLASDALWLDVEQAGGGQIRSDAQLLLTNLGRGFPATARH